MNVEQIEDQVIRDSIKDALLKRATAKEFEDDAKALKEEANEILSVALLEVEDLSAVEEGIGTVSLTVTKRKKLDMPTMKLGLLNDGVSALVIESAEAKATSHSESTSVRFSIWKEPK